MIYITLHFKFATLFYTTQLVDNFGYEIPHTAKIFNFFHKTNSVILVYNFHNILSQDRFFLLLTNIQTTFKQNPSSISELFVASN